MKWFLLLTFNIFLLNSLFAQIVTNSATLYGVVKEQNGTTITVPVPIQVVRTNGMVMELRLNITNVSQTATTLNLAVHDLIYTTNVVETPVTDPNSGNIAGGGSTTSGGTTGGTTGGGTTSGGTTGGTTGGITGGTTTGGSTGGSTGGTASSNTVTNDVTLSVTMQLDDNSTNQITLPAKTVWIDNQLSNIIFDITSVPPNAVILRVRILDYIYDPQGNLIGPVNGGGSGSGSSGSGSGTGGTGTGGTGTGGTGSGGTGSTGSNSNSNTVQLPIEVLGEDQHIEEVKLVLNDNPSDVHGIRLQVHNLGFTNKMALSVNGSSWINLNNRNVDFTKQFDKAMYGMGGGHNTLTFVVPFASNNIIPSVTNIVRFKFNDINKETVGYRVLDVDLVKAQPNGYELNFLHIASWDPVRPVNWGVNTNWINKYIPLQLSTTKIKDDPSKWVPLSTDTAVINQGKDIWFNANISERGVAINAKCTDCHASDGYDLKYFNYSDKSIIARSKYHGLNNEQSVALASYIRSLNVPYQEKGRPWNPPYQPGPGLDSKPVTSWAAGAGIEAVVDYDLDTYKALFPNGMDGGIKYDDGVGPINFNKSLNMREIPLVIQMPDWKDWLPRNHLKDAAPDIWNYISYTNGYRLPTYFKNVLANYRPNDPLWNLKNLYWSHNEVMAYSWIQMVQTTTLLQNHAQNPNNVEAWQNFKIRNVIGPAWIHYTAVKHWEIMNKLGLQEIGHEIYNPNNKDNWNNPLWKSGYGGGLDPVAYQNKTGIPITKAVEKRRWYDTVTFHLAPHISGEATVTDMSSPLWNQTTWGPKSFMWYQIQMLLDDSNKTPSRNIVDWAYLFALSNTTRTHGTTAFDLFKIKSWAIQFLNGLKADEAFVTTAGLPNESIPLEGRYYPNRSQSDLLGIEAQANDHRFRSDGWWAFQTFSASFAAASQNPEQRQAIMKASSKLIDAEIDFMDDFDAEYLIGQGLSKNMPDAWEAGIKYTGGDVNILNKVRNFRSRIWPDYISTYSDRINHVYPDPWPNLR